MCKQRRWNKQGKSPVTASISSSGGNSSSSHQPRPSRQLTVGKGVIYEKLILIKITSKFAQMPLSFNRAHLSEAMYSRSSLINESLDRDWCKSSIPRAQPRSDTWTCASPMPGVTRLPFKSTFEAYSSTFTHFDPRSVMRLSLTTKYVSVEVLKILIKNIYNLHQFNLYKNTQLPGCFSLGVNNWQL